MRAERMLNAGFDQLTAAAFPARASAGERWFADARPESDALAQCSSDVKRKRSMVRTMALCPPTRNLACESTDRAHR